MKSIFKLRMLITIISIIMAFVFYLSISYISNKETFFSTISNKLFWIYSIVSALIIMTLSLTTIYKNDSSKEVEEYYNTAINAITLSKKGNKNKTGRENAETQDITGFMLLNMKEIKEYYVLSKTMAKKSFYLAVLMCISGFIVISSSIAAIFIIKISFIESLIPIIGGTIVEVIAGTSLSVYKKSLEQLNRYYESLHNNERYLSLVSLVDNISEDKKDETYINIINNQLEALKNPQ